MNRQDTVDPVSELFERVSISIKKKELSLLLIVGVIGCLGSMSVFSKSFVHNATSSKNLSTITIAEQAASLTPVLQNIDPYLNISGDFHTAGEITFAIGNYNPQTIYEVDFGDGQLIRSKSASFSHTYQTEGTFDVELIILYNDNSNSIFNTKLDIYSSQAAFLSSL